MLQLTVLVMFLAVLAPPGWAGQPTSLPVTDQVRLLQSRAAFLEAQVTQLRLQEEKCTASKEILRRLLEHEPVDALRLQTVKAAGALSLAAQQTQAAAQAYETLRRELAGGCQLNTETLELTECPAPEEQKEEPDDTMGP